MVYLYDMAYNIFITFECLFIFCTKAEETHPDKEKYI